MYFTYLAVLVIFKYDLSKAMFKKNIDYLFTTKQIYNKKAYQVI